MRKMISVVVLLLMFSCPAFASTESLPTTVTLPANTPGVSAAASPESKVERTVYITRTGKKYHASGCRSLAKLKVPCSLSDAEAKGLGSCGICGGK